MNNHRRMAYAAALDELDLTPGEHEIVGALHGRLIGTLGNGATSVTEQVVFAFNDALKAGTGLRDEVLGSIVHYTNTLIAFGVAGSASCVPHHTISVIKTFFDEAKEAIQHKGAIVPDAITAEVRSPQLVAV